MRMALAPAWLSAIGRLQFRASSEIVKANLIGF